MADANKPVRLSKAAREFNLGIGTIVEFLETKGIQVEAKPNTKLDPEVYAIVLNNFQGDKDAKEAAQRSTVSVDRETIRLASAKKKEVLKEDSPEKIDLSIFKKEKKEKKAKPVPEAPKKEEKGEAPVEQPLQEDTNISGLKVVGKVDFDAQKKEAAEKRAAAEEARIRQS